MIDLTLDKFLLAKEYCAMFDRHFVRDALTVATMIEQYGILDRDSLIFNLSFSLDSNIELINKDKLLNHNLSDDLKRIEIEYDVAIELIEPLNINVYINIFSNIDMDRLTLALCNYKSTLYYVTPINYYELINKKFPEVNYSILFECIVIAGLHVKATDIHFGVRYENMTPRYTIRFRVGNTLRAYKNIKFDREMNQSLLFKLVQNKTKALATDIDASGVVTSINNILGDGALTIRLSANRCLGGYKYVCRFQKLDTVTLKIDELGFPPNVVADIRYHTKKRNGLLLVTGPIRSGKNTTLFAIGNELPYNELAITDYSSPVETLMPFDQVDFGNNIKVLQDAIILAKKQDLNIAFINEIPSKETAFAVRDLVNSAVYVLTTMHINRIWHLPHKLYEFYGESYKDVITQINGVINQKMFTKQCSKCRKQILTSDVEDDLKEILDKYGISNVYINEGCDECNKGSIDTKVQPYAESLIFTDEIKRKLLSCRHPYEMEKVLYELIHERHSALEDTMCRAIARGELDYKSLYHLI